MIGSLTRLMTAGFGSPSSFPYPVPHRIPFSGPDDFPRISTRGHFGVGLRNTPFLRRGHGPTEYETHNLPDPETIDELAVFVHGFMVYENAALGFFDEAREAFDDAGYGHPVVGYTWDAGLGPWQWWAANSVAERNGKKLARFTRDYTAEGVDVRYVAHSLGARVALEAVNVLDSDGVPDDYVESVTLLGGAIGDGSVSLSGEFGASAERAVRSLDNYYKTDDEVLLWAYLPTHGDTAVGQRGIDGTPPSNYEDHDVSFVPDHFSYHESGEGCIPDVVSRF